jgi:hypothetical protein
MSALSPRAVTAVGTQIFTLFVAPTPIHGIAIGDSPKSARAAPDLSVTYDATMS